MYGLKEKHIKAINSVFSKYPQIEKAILYGSRAKGNYRNGSDIDLTLVGDDLDLKTQFKIETKLDDLLLPYKMDLSILHKIENPDFVEHIERVGIVFYEKMVSEWKEYSLSETFNLISGGTPKTSISEYWNGDIPWLSVSDFNNGRKYVYKADKSITKLGLSKSSTNVLKKGQLIISARGTVGIISMLGNDMAFNQSNYGIDAKEGVSDNHFLYYLLKNIVPVLLSNSYGAVFNTITKTTFDHIKINLPELPEQKQIAEILISLDDKIDLLHRQNKTLEAMAETLYESWVFEKDFDSTIKDLTDIQNGYAFKSKSFQDNGTHRVLKIKNISGGIVNIQTTDFVSDENVLKIDKKFKIKTGDILFAMTGAKIGKMGIIPQTEYSLWLNQRVGLFKEKVKGSRFLAYLHLKSDYGFDYIENTATGSAQPNISGTGIENCEFPKFIEEEIKEFSKQLELLYEKVFFNLGQVRKLEQIRDTLLPKLMSGEIKVVENE